MKTKIKYIIIGILIGSVAFPALAMGGSLTASLTQGKSVQEAIQILSEKIDFLIGKTTDLEARADKEEACRKAKDILEEVRYVYSQTSHQVIMNKKIGDYISATETMLKEYQVLAENQDSLCQPSSYEEFGEKNNCRNFFKEAQQQKDKLDKLRELEKQYIIQNEICEQ